MTLNTSIEWLKARRERVATITRAFGTRARTSSLLRCIKFHSASKTLHLSDEWCPQKLVNAEVIERKLANFLSDMQRPEEWAKNGVNAVGQVLGLECLGERIKEIAKIIERLDFRWDMGFITQDKYVAQRTKLKAQLAQLPPIPHDDLAEAHRHLKIFAPNRVMRIPKSASAF